MHFNHEYHQTYKEMISCWFTLFFSDSLTQPFAYNLWYARKVSEVCTSECTGKALKKLILQKKVLNRGGEEGVLLLVSDRKSLPLSFHGTIFFLTLEYRAWDLDWLGGGWGWGAAGQGDGEEMIHMKNLPWNPIKTPWKLLEFCPWKCVGTLFMVNGHYIVYQIWITFSYSCVRYYKNTAVTKYKCRHTYTCKYPILEQS